MQQESVPIWWCIVRVEDINAGGFFAFRIIKAIATTFGEEMQALYSTHADMLSAPRTQVMLFHREPVDTPIKEYLLKQPVKEELPTGEWEEHTSKATGGKFYLSKPPEDKPPEYAW